MASETWPKRAPGLSGLMEGFDAPSGDAHVWLLRAPASRKEDTRTLSELDDSERARAASFVHRRDRLTYLSSHVALRRLLAAYLRVSPENVRFGREACARCGGPHGRPVLLGDQSTLHFSLSHCAGLSLFAVAGSPVGVDVEQLPDREPMDKCIARLHPMERAELTRVPYAERPMRFCRLWTRKEAYLKALGTGLNRELGRDYLGDGRNGDSPKRPDGWTVLNLPCGPEDNTHAAAIAIPAGMRAPDAVRELH
ncbi:4'-phosphopantetheinyl transferase family protein [Streptomyces lunaelactis]|uniref:4'-phosphopantetheinyl transferase family protein n=1 Tax=Streptomyces lunaelactis TaxID=1535768 RepID=UPI00158506F0|nr:4'-phosphopantetheinyl transferase superfamily protein [Streptomyces lunaelactis]NUK01356.1 4'-phosphopantetheinyl transferase superfamily protein [Streptomyces lunaelactis]NUK15333.1 4'-phosphopantetheinyl transferase superfamily protein [Streptomyces lunaelactis]NUK22510.1 4'-phosphopantetheinyl transferase superfamily protein [Streptomyces lunaelactis]